MSKTKSTKIFVSWARERSRVLASCITKWLPDVLPDVQLFHSDDIPKGERWYEALTGALKDCDAGIFCVTPESLRSQWMLFEAGALSQIDGNPRLFTYLYGVAETGGPLGQLQATHFERNDTWQMITSLASNRSKNELKSIRMSFDATWEEFEANVVREIALPIGKVLPDFRGLFENKKTFYEPFPECADIQWKDRIERIARISERLSTPEYAEVMSSDPYMSGAYKTLMGHLDRYDMNIGSYLLKPLEFEDLSEEQKDRLERVRLEILDIVRGLQTQSEPPVFRESLEFESDSTTSGRKNRIHEMQVKMNAKNLSADKIELASSSINWGLDRIVYYLAVDTGNVEDPGVGTIFDLLRIEEEQARTRQLVTGLQPLYYSLECLDNRIKGPLDPGLADKIIEVVGDIRGFIDARSERDTGDHVRRRLDSIWRKLEKSVM